MHPTNNGTKSQRRRVQVLGLLQGLHLAGDRFDLQLDSGQVVQCDYIVGDVSSLAPFFGKRILVNGVAVWDLTGRFYRIDVEIVRSGEGERDVWAVLPGPLLPSELPVERRSPRLGEILASLPSWPADENEPSDEELLAALKRMD